jgi:hypothetical protein
MLGERISMRLKSQRYILPEHYLVFARDDLDRLGKGKGSGSGFGIIKNKLHY